MSGPGIPWTTVENGAHDWVVGALGLANSSVIWAQQNDVRPATPFVSLNFGTVLRRGLDGIVYDDRPLVFSPITVTAVVGDVLTAVAHGLSKGDGPVQVASTMTLPTGLVVLTNYWVVPVDVDHLKLASTFQNAWVPTTLSLSSAGSGTITVVSTANTRKAGAELNARSQGMRKVTLTIQAFAAAANGSSGAAQLLDTLVASLPRRHTALNAAGICVLSLGPVKSTNGTINTTVFEPRAILEVNISLASEVLDTESYFERVKVTPTINAVEEPEITIE